MPIVIRPPVSDPPYSLHDAYVTALRAEGDTLRLVTQYGYVRTTEPYGQVDGDVEITGVDWDFSCVYVMAYTDVLCGNCGSFTGRKMAVEDFLRAYPDASLEVLDETWGYRQVNLDGFLNLPDQLLEFSMSLSYSGQFRYLVRE